MLAHKAAVSHSGVMDSAEGGTVAALLSRRRGPNRSHAIDAPIRVAVPTIASLSRTAIFTNFLLLRSGRDVRTSGTGFVGSNQALCGQQFEVRGHLPYRRHAVHRAEFLDRLFPSHQLWRVPASTTVTGIGGTLTGR
ncbi:MAG: hypothetical protein QOI79_36, partial [Mycobacterium sp.]|nr:hypothetical protein [Mycobacterium sp.]